MSDTAATREHARMSGLWFGAGRDLASMVRTHLFVICNTHSGSTFLRNALATCRLTWNLPYEGRRAVGFVGPDLLTPERSGCPWLRPWLLVWAAEPRWVNAITDAAAYDWPRTRKAWYFTAFAKAPRPQGPKPSVFVVKTPSDICILDDLVAHFADAKFLFMVRNPYAVCEGIIRQFRENLGWNFPAPVPGEPFEATAARHVSVCLEIQRRNLEIHGDRGAFFTYEEMCAAPERVARRIRASVPELDDLNLRQRLRVKTRYHEMLTDMNTRQIARLSPAQVAVLNGVFREYRDAFDAFGYTLMDRSGAT